MGNVTNDAQMAFYYTLYDLLYQTIQSCLNLAPSWTHTFFPKRSLIRCELRDVIAFVLRTTGGLSPLEEETLGSRWKHLAVDGTLPPWALPSPRRARAPRACSSPDLARPPGRRGEVGASKWTTMRRNLCTLLPRTAQRTRRGFLPQPPDLQPQGGARGACASPTRLRFPRKRSTRRVRRCVHGDSATARAASGNAPTWSRRIGIARARSRLRLPPPWRQPRGKSQVNLPQMPPDSGGICMGVD